MPTAIMMAAAGGPDVLRTTDIPVSPPGPGEAQVRQTVIGVNFVDVYYRTGLYLCQLCQPCWASRGPGR